MVVLFSGKDFFFALLYQTYQSMILAHAYCTDRSSATSPVVVTFSNFETSETQTIITGFNPSILGSRSRTEVFAICCRSIPNLMLAFNRTLQITQRCLSIPLVVGTCIRTIASISWGIPSKPSSILD